MDLADRIISMVAAHAAIRSIALVGSRADGTATAFSDWDFRVEADEFEAASKALPHLLAPLEPLVQQWDRLSPE
jgi:predicted nucleotidyltransferase